MLALITISGYDDDSSSTVRMFSDRVDALVAFYRLRSEIKDEDASATIMLYDKADTFQIVTEPCSGAVLLISLKTCSPLKQRALRTFNYEPSEV